MIQRVAARLGFLKRRALRPSPPWRCARLRRPWAAGTDEPAHYWFINLPRNLPWQVMIDTIMGRWRIERDHEELKQELGLGHYEGRNWRGFHPIAYALEYVLFWLALEPYVVKYGKVFSAIQFLLSPDREDYVLGSDLVIRFVLMQLGLLLVMGLAFYPVLYQEWSPNRAA